jgi:uncharacterized membrane protein
MIDGGDPMQQKDSRRSVVNIGSGTTIGAAIGLLFDTLLLGIFGALAGAVVGILGGLIWDLQKRDRRE